MRRGSSRSGTGRWWPTRAPPPCRAADRAARRATRDRSLYLAGRLDRRAGLEIPLYLVELGVIGETALRDGDQCRHERFPVGRRNDDAGPRLSHDLGSTVVAGQGQDRAARTEVLEDL